MCVMEANSVESERVKKWGWMKNATVKISSVGIIWNFENVK